MPEIAEETEISVDPSFDRNAKGGDVNIAAGEPGGRFHVQTQVGFWRRLWFMVSNPFVYLFTGHWRL